MGIPYRRVPASTEMAERPQGQGAVVRGCHALPKDRQNSVRNRQDHEADRTAALTLVDISAAPIRGTCVPDDTLSHCCASICARMAELVDAPASGAGAGNGVEVRVLFRAPAAVKGQKSLYLNRF